MTDTTNNLLAPNTDIAKSLQPNDVDALESLCQKLGRLIPSTLPKNLLLQSIGALCGDMINISRSRISAIKPTFKPDELKDFVESVNSLLVASRTNIQGDKLLKACQGVKKGISLVRCEYEARKSHVDLIERREQKRIDTIQREFSLDMAGRLTERQVLEKYWSHIAEEEPDMDKIGNPQMLGEIPETRDIEDGSRYIEASQNYNKIVLSSLPILESLMDQIIESTKQKQATRKR